MNSQERNTLLEIHELITSGRADDARIELEKLLGIYVNDIEPEVA